jgi:hypothetical protein
MVIQVAAAVTPVQNSDRSSRPPQPHISIAVARSGGQGRRGNGQVVYENGAMTAARPGKVIYGPGKSAAAVQ